MIAADAEIHADHLVLLDSAGKLAALFLMEIVESWTELPGRRNNPSRMGTSPSSARVS